MKTHYSIAELIGLELDGLPKTRRGLEKLVLNKGWNFVEVPSRGAGGIKKEYEPTPDICEQIQKKYIMSAIAATPALPAVAQSPEIEIVGATVSPAQLADWQRQCAESRLMIVRSIQVSVRNGVKKTKAIEQFVADAIAGTLPEHLQAVLSLANAKAGNDRAVSRRSVFDWVGLVDEAENRKVSAVAMLAPKPRMVKIPDWAGALLKLYGQPQKPNLTSVLEVLPNYLNANIECPSYSQAYRFLTEKMGSVEVQKGRMGSREIKNIKGFKRRDTTQLMPADVYTADGHCFDAEVAHPLHGKPFRPEITAIIDVATRYLVGYSIDLAESGWAVLDAIRMSAVECGIPALFYVDNGSGYVNDLMKAEGRGLMSRLGTEMTHALPYNSQAKGLMERSHQSMWVKAAKKLPTYIGKDMDDEARQKVFKITRNEIKIYGQSKLMISWPEFLEFAAEVVREYNNKPHSGLPKFVDPVTLKRRHYSPAESWEVGTNHPDTEIIKVDDTEAQDLFRPYAMRKVRRCEIDLFGNKYFSKDLEQYHDDIVNVGYDIHDPQHIWVRDESGRLICKATWNANKTHYFAKSVIEQAKEKRAAGRLRRLASKQAEVLEELSPAAMLEHVEKQTLPVHGFNPNHAEVLAELNSLETPRDVVYFPRKAIAMPVDDEAEVLPFDKDKVDAERWMSVQRNLIADFASVSEKDFSYWKLFQQSKRFKSLLESNEELRRCFESAASVKRV